VFWSCTNDKVDGGSSDRYVVGSEGDGKVSGINWLISLVFFFIVRLSVRWLYVTCCIFYGGPVNLLAGSLADSGPRIACLRGSWLVSKIHQLG
jgi:hypothetical protein